MLSILFDDPARTSSGALLIVGILLLRWALWPAPSSHWPLVNGKRWFEITTTKSKDRFVANGKDILLSSFKRLSKGFRLGTDNGPMIILSPEYVDEFRSEDRLCPVKFQAELAHTHLPGFEILSDKHVPKSVFTDFILRKLTPAIDSTAPASVTRLREALESTWTNSSEWHQIDLHSSVQVLSHTTTSPIFVGPELSSSKAWEELTYRYVGNFPVVACSLRLWPKFSQRFVNMILPSCTSLRKDVNQARQMVNEVLQKRAASQAARISQGLEPEKFSDGLQWWQELSGPPCDPACLQLALIFSAVHSTVDLLSQTILNLAERPELVDELRQEIIAVRESQPWGKAAFYKLGLMDSVLKETQRLKPVSIATEDVTFSDGLVIPKGSLVMMSCHNMREDSVTYPNPLEFDGHRFRKMRESPTNGAMAHLVSSSQHHMGFGIGTHSCPGRFFIAAGLKLTLSQILLNYDLRLSDPSENVTQNQGLFLMPNFKAKVEVRRREPEIEL
uniref:Cytochrome P450 monooxygenase prhN n=1 Tax=Penicillium brasilianum TaxID=104259 RepID=PRHN_PENBI|nr:RecName: Full=Cytochrome P450 monooxygenase prhN; AltName: Full=Paraherquonin biosynthesis cluster protein N [Penicillium brasilianum]BAV69315.1 PrhN [Penicillium brasilianum]